MATRKPDKECCWYPRGYIWWMPWAIFWLVFGASFFVFNYNSSTTPFVWYGISGLFGLFFFIFMLIFLFRIFFGGFFGWYRRYSYEYSGYPEEILRQRYARGEITYSRFRKMMKDLKEDRLKRS